LAEPKKPAAAPAPASMPTPVEHGEVRPLWQSEQLFGPLHEICIQHGGSVYRLRKTSLGKLILTK
jgi:hemin uptake protein HemP